VAQDLGRVVEGVLKRDQHLEVDARFADAAGRASRSPAVPATTRR
jgi:hypothetical protein